MRKHRTLIYVVIFLLTAFTLGSHHPAGVSAADENVYKNIKLLNEVLNYVTEKYVTEIDPGELYIRAIQGMLNSLDPHTSLLTPKDYTDLREDTEGSFGGIGIQIDVRDGYPTVIAPLPGTPADELGVQAGDRIVDVEGESTAGWTVDDAVKKLKGPKGTKVRVKVLRQGFPDLIHYTIVRDIIEIKSVRYSFMLEPSVGYARLTAFSKQSGEELDEAITALEKSGMKKLILDLRNNPGGLLTEAVEVSEMFLDRNDLVVSTRGRVTNQNNEYNSRTTAVHNKYPIVVLINGGSASASEIFAGAMQDHDKALLLGTTSFGKGSVQTIFKLSGGYALRLTTALYYTPSGRSIHKKRNRQANELLLVDEEEDGDFGEEFKTDEGRIVYGGGGIKPDVEVKPDTLSEAGLKLLRERLFFKYAVDYKSKHPIVIKSAEEKPRLTQNFVDHFQVTDEMIEQFKDFVRAENISFTDGEFDPELDYFKTRLTFEIIKAYWGENAAYQKVATKDVQIKRALELLKEGNNLKDIYHVAHLQMEAEE